MDLKQPSNDNAFIFQRLGWEVEAKPAIMTATTPALTDDTNAPAAPTIEITGVAKTTKVDTAK